MPVRASEIFDFLELQEAFVVERHEIGLAAFSILRRSLSQIVLKLRDYGDQGTLEVIDRIRVLLSEWLTVPMPFDCSIPEAVSGILGEPASLQARWGSDVVALYETAVRAAETLPSIESPIREKLRTVIRELRTRGQAFKVYCHRRARPYFESLLVLPSDSPFGESAFLHSVRDYREAEPFDALIKVGPLRTHGWGSAPDAILTAPRFCKLVQVVWSGCSDEPDFGYDPSSPPQNFSTAGTDAPSTSGTWRSRLKWTTRVTHSGEDPAIYGGDADELQTFRDMVRHGDKRRATLVQVDGQYGILYPPRSEVLSYDPDPRTQEPIDHRLPAETLAEGMFVIFQFLDEVDLGGVRAEHGQYSKIWKERLEHEWQRDAADLARRLRAAGLDLVYLSAAIRHWCMPPSTVIHAPQQVKHFEILIQVLGLGGTDNSAPHQRALPWWWRAWHEVARSRGEAIHAGVLGQEIVEEQLLVILRRLLPDIRQKAAEKTAFQLPVPTGNDMKGDLFFFRVCGIEEGFSAPEVELRAFRELNVIDQWRE